MKVVVFSDSHGNTANMADVIRLEHPDRVLHLGDCVSDAQEIERRFPGINVNYVRGNCDGPVSVPDVMTPILDGKKVLMTHGHLQHVKSDYDVAIWNAREEKADILLFGHTHRDYCERLDDGLWVMNPGSCRGWGPSTYGVIAVESGEAFCYLERM
ncbi:MAG: YfcE family phosphodiesterase [Clostridia bacterium]|nr:YfcE family phosphodiesterase [Clostridia bacterium]